MARLVALCALVAAALVCSACADKQYFSGVGTVYLEGDSYKFVVSKMDTDGVAWGNYTDQSVNPSAFGRFGLKTNPKYNDTAQMYAAGYLEGALTQDRIFEHYENMYNWTIGNFKNRTISPKVIDFLFTQDKWIRHNIATNETEFWRQMGLLYAQFDGIIAGYQSVAPADQAMTVLDFMIINGIGDLLDLIPAVSVEDRIDWDSMTPEEMLAAISLRGHCSGLIKTTGDFSELFAGHSSWFTYSSMLRIYKHYDFSVTVPGSNGAKMSFSSYPGLLSSLDDFYMMLHSNLVMVQTTNGIFNRTLYELVKPSSLLAWHRVRLANMMAQTGKEWADTVAMYNSGTYNNQYMVVDYKLFTPGKGILPNTLWVVEQIPGLVESADESEILAWGYWASFNVPFFRTVYDKSGYPEFIAKYQDFAPQAVQGLNWQTAPRSMIFRRDQDNVVDMDSYKAIMRQNEYKTDPYSGGSPFGAICSRGDLAGQTGGCYDTKVTSAEWIAAQQADVINGPTTSGGKLPPFSWAPEFDATKHVGQPHTYDFVFETMVFGL